MKLTEFRHRRLARRRQALDDFRILRRNERLGEGGRGEQQRRAERRRDDGATADRHPRECGGPGGPRGCATRWIPAFAGMTGNGTEH